MPRAKDKADRVVGLVCPERYYTIEAAKRFAGIGRPQLIEARKAGVITPIPVGRFLWIRGEQIIAWIEWHAKNAK